jgi:hypothetical protein
VFERYYARFGAPPKLVDWHGSLEEWARLTERALTDDRALTADDLARAQGQEGGQWSAWRGLLSGGGAAVPVGGCCDDVLDLGF